MYHNIDYCKKYNIDYSVHMLSVENNVMASERIQLILDALKKYEYAIWYDADAEIVSLAEDFRTIWKDDERFIGFVKYNVPTIPIHINSGAFYARKSPEVIAMLKDWLSRPIREMVWREQLTLNDMYDEGTYKDIIREIDPKWNDLTFSRMSENPIVLACHGYNSPDEKYYMMVRDVIANYGMFEKYKKIIEKKE
jgi:hypothetical protein